MSGNNSIKALSIPYSQAEFIINKEQCSASMYIGDTVELSGNNLFITGFIELDRKIILLVDLDSFFRKIFKAEPVGESRLALIREKKSFSPTATNKISEIEEVIPLDSRNLSDNIAFRVASATVMLDIPVSSLNAQPRVMAEMLEKEGIIAVSFPGNGKIRYVVDLDVLFENKILGIVEAYSENPDC